MLKRLKSDKPPIHLFSFLLILFWIILITTSFLYFYKNNVKEPVKISLMMARDTFQHELSYFRWNSLHGGVYVKAGKGLDPNQFLPEHSRIVETVTGEKLILVSPEEMSRELNRLSGVAGRIGIRFTALNPLNPESRPNPWEQQALEKITSPESEIIEVDESNDTRILRYLKPIPFEERCSQCHQYLNINQQSISGALSITIPMNELYEMSRKEIYSQLLFHLIVLIVGIAVISTSSWKIDSQIKLIKATRRELEEQKGYFQSLFDSSPDALIIFDRQGKVRNCNRAFTRIFEYQPQEIIGKNLDDFIAPDYLEPEARELTAQVLKGEKLYYETIRKTRDGKEIDVSVVADSVQIGSGDKLIYVIYRDITDRKSAERVRETLLAVTRIINRIRNYESLFRAVLFAINSRYELSLCLAFLNPDEVETSISLWVDEKGNIKVNSNFEDFKQLVPVQELLSGKEILREIDNAEKMLLELISVNIPEGYVLYEPIKIQNRVIGGLIFFREKSLENFSEEFITLIRSISMQIAIACDHIYGVEALRRSEEQYRLIVENSRDAIIIVQEGKIIFHNQAFRLLLGFEVSEINSTELNDFIAESEEDWDKCFLRVEPCDKLERIEATFQKKDGKKIIVEATTEIIDYRGKPAVFAILRDVTEQKQLLKVLEASLEGTKGLKGLIPVCASCKKIRDESKKDKPWVAMELFLKSRLPEIEFTHSICPECMQKLYPEYVDFLNEKEE